MLNFIHNFLNGTQSEEIAYFTYQISIHFKIKSQCCHEWKQIGLFIHC